MLYLFNNEKNRCSIFFLRISQIVFGKNDEKIWFNAISKKNQCICNMGNGCEMQHFDNEKSLQTISIYIMKNIDYNEEKQEKGDGIHG